MDIDSLLQCSQETITFPRPKPNASSPPPPFLGAVPSILTLSSHLCVSLSST